MPEVLDDWTSRKLFVLQRYLCAFTNAARADGYGPAYIDAFTCADYCAEEETDPSRLGGFCDLAAASPKAFLKHAVRTALATEPTFDGYLFIERDRRRRRLLEAVAHGFRHRNVQIRQSDANREVDRVSRLDWRRRRAVLFVDVYASNLEWKTVEAVSRTKAIDLWLLLPLGFGSAQRVAGWVVPGSWRDRISHLLGAADWFVELEGPAFDLERCVSTVNRCFEDRLKSTFAHVGSPGVLRSQSGVPLYALYFASSAADSGQSRAVELANQLLEHIGD
jgi:three-Cys-motif partner protein